MFEAVYLPNLNKFPTWAAANPKTVFDVCFANSMFAFAFYEIYTFYVAGFTAFEASEPTAIRTDPGVIFFFSSESSAILISSFS